MARLLKKISSDFNGLNHTWSSRDDFMTTVLADPNFLPKVRYILPNDGEFLQTNDNWIKHMFMPNGWQLTTFGCAVLLKAYGAFRIQGPSKDALTGRQVIKLNQLINGPWYMNTKSLYVWSQTVNFELHLFDKDLNQYIDSYFPK